MEITIREFASLRLREIDRHLRAYYKCTTNQWIIRFTHATKIRACEIHRGLTHIIRNHRGRVPRHAYCVNTRVTSQLEQWAKEQTGFESQWAIARPSRFNTRRKSLLPSEDERVSKPATLSPFEQDEVQWDLRRSSQISEHAVVSTMDIMSNQEPQQGDTAQCSTQSGNTLSPLPHPTDPQACGASDLGTGIEGTETLEAGGSSPGPDTPTGGGAGETPLSGSLAI